MSIKIDELIQMIEHIAPASLAETWDNTGIQINISEGEIHRILVCLDVGDDIIDEAMDNSCDFILSHHPLLFDGIKRITQESDVGRWIIRLVQAGISVYASHTSFDRVDGGNNDFLAALLKLERIETPDEAPIMRTGFLQHPMGMDHVCKLVAEALNLSGSVRMAGDEAKIIRKVAVCSGSGASLLEEAAGLNCDLLLTGDVKYHDAQKAKGLGVNLIDGGHFETEIFFAKNMAEKLQSIVDGKAEIIVSQKGRNCILNKML